MFRNPSDPKVLLIIALGVIVFISSIEFSYKNRIRLYKLTLTEENWQVIIRYRWVRRLHLYMAVYGVLIACVLPGVIYYGARSSLESGDYWLTACFMFVGWIMIVAAVVGLINSTVLTVRDNNIMISIVPLPTLRHRQKSLQNVSEVYYKQELYESRSDYGLVYTFFADTDNRQGIKLIGMIDRKEDALKINEAIQGQIARVETKPKPIKDIDRRSYIDKLRGYRR